MSEHCQGMATSNDPHDLNRFVEARRDRYTQALAELRDGCKRLHWMWSIFPQIAGRPETVRQRGALRPRLAAGIRIPPTAGAVFWQSA
ncbi:DUF1810 family protein [Thiohalocapsa marina]